ncbi:hypothetical protein NQ315_008228 [Exocentrus adspersus]|uniref:Uncharacterized protein n=1 Tax=Exocentrus adspersus TaxID=1586481 RepID=A0AAV8VM51_9CUCU|nr:hypothetical protein NQ315_008228 [Exocentrus adspersus]
MVNVSKTEIVYFCNQSNNRCIHLNINNIVMTSIKKVKFLGIYIDESLRWCDHIDHLCKKLNNANYAISNLKNSMPVNAVLNVYYGMVYSHLSYNVLLFGNSTDAERVLITQKRITCLYIKENIHKLVKNVNYHSYATRNLNMLCIPKHRTTKFEASPAYQGIKLFNHLPRKFLVVDYIQFKRNLKQLLLTKAYYSVQEFASDNNLDE